MQMLAAGVVQLRWSVMAPSQQVQLGAAPASGLSVSAQHNANSEGDSARKKPRRQPKKQDWRDFAKDEMQLLPRMTEDCTLGGRAVRAGHIVQVRAAACGTPAIEKLCLPHGLVRASCCHREPCVLV